MKGDFQAFTYQKSRKPRICWFTGKAINVGDFYHRVSGKYEGAMYNIDLHKDHETMLDAIDQKPEILDRLKDER